MQAVRMCRLIAERTGIPRLKVDKVFNEFVKLAMESLVEGDDVRLPGVCVLKAVYIPSRHKVVTGRATKTSGRWKVKVNRGSEAFNRCMQDKVGQPEGTHRENDKACRTV